MRILVIVGLIFLQIESAQSSAPAPTTAEIYVNLALSTDTLRLQGGGPNKCGYAFSNAMVENEATFEVRYSNKPEEAQQRLALLCIKERCPQVGRWMIRGLEYQDNLSGSDITEFYKAQGYPPAQIESMIQNRKTIDRQKLSQLTCTEASQALRTYVFDSCFAMPMVCGKK